MKNKKGLLYLLLPALIGLGVYAGKSYIRNIFTFHTKSDSIPGISQKLKVDSANRNNILQNAGAGTIIIQQTGDKSTVTFPTNPPTANKPKNKANTGTVYITGNPKNLVLGTVNGHNGDIYYNSEFELTQGEVQGILTELAQYRRDSGITTKAVNLCLAQGSNGQRVMLQLDTILTDQGYNTSFPSVVTRKPINGINISCSSQEEGVNILIGYLHS